MNLKTNRLLQAPRTASWIFPTLLVLLTDPVDPSLFYWGIYQCFAICLSRTAQLRQSICFSARSCFCYPIFQLDWQRHKKVKRPARVGQCQWLGTDWSPRSSWLRTLHWTMLPFM